MSECECSYVQIGVIKGVGELNCLLSECTYKFAKMCKYVWFIMGECKSGYVGEWMVSE